MIFHETLWKGGQGPGTNGLDLWTGCTICLSIFQQEEIGNFWHQTILLKNQFSWIL